MKLIFESEVFQTEKPLLLHSLASHAFTGRHRIEIEDEQHAAFSTWFEALSIDLQDQWRTAIDQSAVLETREPATRVVRIAPIEESDWTAVPPRLSLKDATDNLNRPFQVLVENSVNDRMFLLRMAGQYLREVILDLERRGIIAFLNGGGISVMPTIIQDVAAREPWMLNHYWVLFDSDALAPGAPSDQSESLRRACIDNNIAHHQLGRRNIENYLTIASLRAWVYSVRGRVDADRRAKFDSFRTMTDDQRFHFSLKSGFKDQHSTTLYANISERDRHILASGFGRGIAQLFHGELVAEQDLRRDSSWQELQRAVYSLIAIAR